MIARCPLPKPEVIYAQILHGRMTLSLSARPTIVARAAGLTLGAWDWLIEPDDVATLRLAVANGLVGTAQRRVDGGAFVLVAWNTGAQREAAEEAVKDRKRRAAERLYHAPVGYTPRIYRPPARAVGCRTVLPYMHEPAAW